MSPKTPTSQPENFAGGEQNRGLATAQQVASPRGKSQILLKVARTPWTQGLVFALT
jgi:hypothetical protein